MSYDPRAGSKKSWMRVKIGVTSPNLGGRWGDESYRYEGRVGSW